MLKVKVVEPKKEYCIMEYDGVEAYILWDSVNSSPDFSHYSDSSNFLLSEWEKFQKQGLKVEIVTELDPFVPSPDFEGLIDSLAFNIGDKKYPLVQAWYNSLPAAPRDTLQMAINARDLSLVQDRLVKLIQAGNNPEFSIPKLDEVTMAQLLELLIDFTVPVEIPESSE
jgi:hypothetical protein